MSRTATRQQNPGRATDASGHAPGRPRHYIHIPKTSGERIADAVATGMGSWRFIIAQSVIVGIWVLINLLAFLGHWGFESVHSPEFAVLHTGRIR